MPRLRSRVRASFPAPSRDLQEFHESLQVIEKKGLTPLFSSSGFHWRPPPAAIFLQYRVNQFARRIRVPLLALVGLLAVGVLSGWTYQKIMEARDQRRLPPPGKLVDVGGHRMHIYCQGSGSPIVVVEQGIGARSLGWARLNEQMSAVTTVCAYDRVGMGYSDPVSHATLSEEVARNLHQLLRRAGISEDIVLVGWGCMLASTTDNSPNRSKGWSWSIRRTSNSFFAWENPTTTHSIRSSWIGILRQSAGSVSAGRSRRGGGADSPSPPPIRDRLIALNLKSHLPRTLLAAGAGLRADLLAGKNPPSLADLPLIVISEGQPNNPFMQEHLRTWFELQEELSRLSSNGRHIVMTKSAHAIHRSEPELIIEAVREVMSSARQAH